MTTLLWLALLHFSAMATEITPQAVGAAITELLGLLSEGSAQPEEKPLTDDEIAALKARGYEVAKAEKPAEKAPEAKQGAGRTGITNVTDLLKTAAERVGQSSSPDSLSKIADPTRRADAQVLQEHRNRVQQAAGQYRR